MLHSALVITAYLMMIFVPCACAQWGDVLMADWWQARFAQRRYKRLRVRSVAPVVAAIQAEAVAMEVEVLAAAAFVEPPPMQAPRFVAKPVRYRAMKHRAPADPSVMEKMQSRVAMRLAEVAAKVRSESSAAIAAAAETSPPMAAAVPVPVANHVPLQREMAARNLFHVEPVPIGPIMLETPSADELEALYPMERAGASPPGAVAVAVGADADSGDSISIAA